MGSALMQKIHRLLMVQQSGRAGPKFLVSILKNAEMVGVTRYGKPGGDLKVAEPRFKVTETVSLSVVCKTPGELDEFSRRLSEVGEEGQCGWLQDKYGVVLADQSEGLAKMLSDPDPEKSKRVMEAMLKRKKIDIGSLKPAYDPR
jgi:predicted 3-demethylubiquinone-9 3-methyltransferase (glyoxalase superfamily)